VDQSSARSTTPAEENETSLVPKSSTSTEETGGGARPSDITVPDIDLAPGTSSGTPAEEEETSLVPKSSTSTEETGGGARPSDITVPDIDLAPGTSSGDSDTIDSNMEVDPPQSSGQDMDIDIIPFDDVSNGAGDSIQNDGRNFDVAADTIAHADGDKNSDTVAAQDEHVAKEAQAVVMAPAKPKPIRYLDGKRVSEYEWERSEKIKENSQLLVKLGLNDTGKQLFGKKQGTEGKENRGIEDRPLKTKRKKTWAGAGQRKLRSSEKAVPNTSVSIVINIGLAADLSVVLM
jgi:hypothetical protein